MRFEVRTETTTVLIDEQALREALGLPEGKLKAVRIIESNEGSFNAGRKQRVIEFEIIGVAG